MLQGLQSHFNDFLHLFYPHNCLGCGTDILENTSLICIKCFYELPETGFFSQSSNGVEKKLIGRIKIEAAGSAFYFTKDSLLQTLLFELKYRGSKDAGIFLGKLAAQQILKSNRFNDIDILVPVPLNAKKQKNRGYNQSSVIAESIAEVLQKPVLHNVIERPFFTETQTHKGRISRWENMQGVFKVINKQLFEGKHILLVDDVITTGATLETCGSEILKVEKNKT